MRINLPKQPLQRWIQQLKQQCRVIGADIMEIAPHVRYPNSDADVDVSPEPITTLDSAVAIANALLAD